MKFKSCLIIPFLAGAAAAADLYVADFSTAGVGSTHNTGGDALETSPIAGANWSIFWSIDPLTDGSTNKFITEGGQLVSDDWGGEASFETDEIDVSGEDTVNIETIAATSGSGVFNAGSEGFNWYYILDGVRTDGLRITSDGNLDYSAGVDTSAADTLVVGFTFEINGAGDGFQVASVVVNDGEITPEITVSMNPPALGENAGTSTATVTLSVAPVGSLVLDLSVDDATEASVPATVTIPGGSLTGTFQVTGVNDTLSDGPQLVTLTVEDPNALYGSDDVTFAVTDDEPFTVPDVTLNEIRVNINNAYTGDGEYFELTTTQPNASLDRISLVAVSRGVGNQKSGVVSEIIDLTGETMNGNFFVAADPEQNFVDAGSVDLEVSLDFDYSHVTFLLVSDFNAVLGDDLDTDDDGTLDFERWGTLLDTVSLVNTATTPTEENQVYAATLDPAGPVVGPDGNFIPAHVYKSSTNPDVWIVGLFFVDGGENFDSPGASNDGGGVTPVDAELVINSFSIDLAGGEGTINASGLGTKIWTVEFSNSLGQSGSWTPVSGGASEVDQPDGSVNFNFFFTPGSSPTGRFYRLVEVAN